MRRDGEAGLRCGADIATWLVLLALVGASLGLAYLSLGWGNLVVALAIAVLQAAIVAAIFMELNRPKTLMRLCAAAALIFLAVLFVLSFADYLSRPLQIEGAGQPVELPGSAPGGRH